MQLPECQQRHGAAVGAALQACADQVLQRGAPCAVVVVLCGQQGLRLLAGQLGQGQTGCAGAAARHPHRSQLKRVQHCLDAAAVAGALLAGSSQLLPVLGTAEAGVMVGAMAGAGDQRDEGQPRQQKCQVVLHESKAPCAGVWQQQQRQTCLLQPPAGAAGPSQLLALPAAAPRQLVVAAGAV